MGDLSNTFQNYYRHIVGPYWDKERRHIDNHYTEIPFPFEQIDTPQYSMVFKWQQYEFEGYLNTWSSLQHFKKAENGFNPIPNLMIDMSAFWGEFERKLLYFPIFLKLGRVKK